MRRSSIAVVIAGAAAVGWAVAPVISIVRRGTVDQLTIRAWHDEIARLRSRSEDHVEIPDQRARAGRAAEHHGPSDRPPTGTGRRS